MGPLSVEAEDFVGDKCEHLTSMRKLEAARLKGQERVGK